LNPIGIGVLIRVIIIFLAINLDGVDNFMGCFLSKEAALNHLDREVMVEEFSIEVFFKFICIGEFPFPGPFFIKFFQDFLGEMEGGFFGLEKVLGIFEIIFSQDVFVGLSEVVVVI